MIPGVTENYSRHTKARQRQEKSGLFLNSFFEGSSSRSPGASAWRRRRKLPCTKQHLRFLGNRYLKYLFFIEVREWYQEAQEGLAIVCWFTLFSFFFLGFLFYFMEKQRKVPESCNNFITDGRLFPNTRALHINGAPCCIFRRYKTQQTKQTVLETVPTTFFHWPRSWWNIMISWECNTAVFPFEDSYFKMSFWCLIAQIVGVAQPKMVIKWVSTIDQVTLCQELYWSFFLGSEQLLPNQCPFTDFDESGWEMGSLLAACWKQPVLMMWLPAGMCNFIMFAATLVQPQEERVPCCRRCCMAGILC